MTRQAPLFRDVAIRDRLLSIEQQQPSFTLRWNGRVWTARISRVGASGREFVSSQSELDPERAVRRAVRKAAEGRWQPGKLWRQS